MNALSSDQPSEVPSRRARALGPIPASGGWRPGDPVAARQFATVTTGRPFQLQLGGSLPEVQVAYETWGTLNDDRSNAVLVCHALTGDAHASGKTAPGQSTPGWWDDLIGPGKPVDTDRWFVVCSNVLGGCQGTTGPSSPSPTDGRPYGPRFPIVTIRDMVRAQALLADRLEIRRFAAVIGGSMGGMQALEWGVMFPDRVARLALMSTAPAASAQQIAWSLAGRRAIESDPKFFGGDYYDAGPGGGPHAGMEVARIIAQVTYRSEEVYRGRFGRAVAGRPDRPGAAPFFEVESYLDYHGDKFARRFDANSYIRLNHAMDMHDIGNGRGGVDSALLRVSAPALVVAVTSDSLYPPYQQETLASTLALRSAALEFVTIDSPDGHDGFLLATEQLSTPLQRLLDADAPQPNVYTRGSTRHG